MGLGVHWARAERVPRKKKTKAQKRPHRTRLSTWGQGPKKIPNEASLRASAVDIMPAQIFDFQIFQIFDIQFF